MNIFLFSASLRRESFNRKLIAEAASVFKKLGSPIVHENSLADFKMPLYDGDLEETDGLPQGVKAFISSIQTADALVIAGPEYNGGISGVLKNAIDWASRADSNPFIAKPILLLGATPGGLAALRGLWHTRVPLAALGAHVYPDMFGLGSADQAFDVGGCMKDPKSKERLAHMIQKFSKYSEALKNLKEST